MLICKGYQLAKTATEPYFFPLQFSPVGGKVLICKSPLPVALWYGLNGFYNSPLAGKKRDASPRFFDRNDFRFALDLAFDVASVLAFQVRASTILPGLSRRVGAIGRSCITGGASC